MKRAVGLPWAVALALCSVVMPLTADTLHDIGAGEFQHHDSHWIFPGEVGGLTRIGAPQDIDGSVDVAAYYEGRAAGGRISASVAIYSPESAAAEANYERAKTAVAPTAVAASSTESSTAPSPASSTGSSTESSTASSPASSTKSSAVWSESVFEARSEPTLRGSLAVHGPSLEASSQTRLYFFDTGNWIVSIRVVIPAVEQLEAADRFVRAQRWDSLEATSS